MNYEFFIVRGENMLQVTDKIDQLDQLDQLDQPDQPDLNKSFNPFNPISTKIVSNTPGRLRLRVAPENRKAQTMEHISNFLTLQPHISKVRTNIHHGSILIHHDDQTGTLSEILASLKHIGIIFTYITQGQTEAATVISHAVIDLNRRVEVATNGTVDLDFLFPLGLGILSVRQLIIKGLQLEVIPWYVLAWYAFNSFLKLNKVNQSPNY